MISMGNQAEKKCVVEPIHGSGFILAAQFILLLLIFDGLFGLIYYFLNLGFTLPFDLHHHLAIVLLSLFVIKLIFQVFVISFVVLSWANHVFYLTSDEIVVRKGIMDSYEMSYKYDSVRSIRTDRSFLGRIFGYADLSIIVSTKIGERKITLSGISSPQKYETMFRECCKNLSDKQEIVFNKN